MFLFLTQTKTEGRYHRSPSLVPPLLFTILVKTDKRYIALYILRTVSYIFPLPLQRPHCLLQAPPLSAHGIPVEYRSQLLVDMLSIRISNLSPVMFHSLACEPPWTAVPSLKSCLVKNPLRRCISLRLHGNLVPRILSFPPGNEGG